MFVTYNYNYMLDSNGIKLKPKKSEVHGMDIWALVSYKMCIMWNFP